jgi:hypothetical protein
MTDIEPKLQNDDDCDTPEVVDREVEIISLCYRELSSLDARAQARVLDWLEARLKWDHTTKAEAVGSNG